jgi:hypothetical protein
MTSQDSERVLRGPKGEQGERGEQGKGGEPLNPATRRALAFFLLLSLAIGGANLLWTAHVVQGNNQQKCATVERLATIPIPRPVAGHESREYAAAAEQIYRTRAAELGCTRQPGKAP